MADLQEKQFELDGVVFGMDCPVDISGFRPQQPEIVGETTQRVGGDGVRRGRQRRGAATWGFDLFTNLEEEEDGWEALNALKEVWDAEEERHESDVVMPLRYRWSNETRLVHGIPQRWDQTIDNATLFGNIKITADFVLTSPLIMDDVLNTHTMSIAPTLSAGAGVRVPFTVPFTSLPRSSPRESDITVGGERPTPIVVTVTGPVAQATIQIGDWEVVLLDPVVPGDPVTIDPHPWVASATKQSGGSVRTNVRRTRVSKMWLPPGQHSIVFTGIDPSGTATVTVSWRNARRALR